MGTSTYSSFGELLKQYRITAGLTQEEVAERAGLSVRTVSDLERGVNKGPRRDTLSLLAGALELSPGARVRLARAAQEPAPGATGTPSRPARVGRPRRPTPEQPRPEWRGLPPGSYVPTLVGRERELALLERHLAGQGAPLLLLAGEPGIGKSRLLYEAAARAAQVGWRVLSGGCSRGVEQEPYAPLLGALQHHLDSGPPARRAADLLGCAWLVRLLPELAEDGIEPLPGWALPPDQARRLIFRAVGRFLANVAGPAGTLLLLDDLHWAGADALDLLTAIVHGAGAALRVVATYRDTDLQPDTPLAATLAELGRAGWARRHTVAPLTAEEVEDLLGSLLADLPGDRAAHTARLARGAGGVPFFLVSRAQALRLDGAVPGEDAIPWDVEQSIRQRVAPLSGLGRELLEVVALSSGAMPPTLLAALVGEPEPAVPAALDTACRARLLMEVEQGYQFTHDLIRGVVEAGIGSGRRAMLHRRIAETLEREAADSGTEPPLAALAHHYGCSTAQEKALRYLELAGDRACSQVAHATAEGHYRELVGRLDRLGRARESTRVREKLGSVLATAGRYDAALIVLEQAAECVRAAGDLESLGRLTAQIGHIHYNRGSLEEGIARLHPVLACLEARGPSSALAMLYASLAELNLHAGYWAEEFVAAEQAGQVARLAGDERTLARAESLRGAALFLMGRVEEALGVLEATVELAEAAGEFACLVEVLYCLAWINEERGELDRSEGYAERALAIAERLGDPALIADGIVKRGVLAHVRGQWEQARGRYAQAAAIHRQIGISPISCAAGSVLLVSGRLSQVEGAWEDAGRYLEGSREISAPQGKRSGLRHTESVLAEREILAGHPDAACRRLVPLLDRAGVEESMVTTAVLPVLAWAYLELGEPDRALRTVGEALRRGRAGRFRLSLVDTLRVHALVAMQYGRWGEAAGALEEGLSLARQIPYPYAEARLQQVYGELHACHGKPGTARERLEAAVAIFRRLGARRDRERSEELLAALD